MAVKYWIGKAVAVAQVLTGSIDSVDATPANNTFTVTIGGVAVSVPGVTSAASTAAALVAALNASTHPYFSGITWANPSAGNITATADTAGVPFTATLTETGAGTGAVTDFSTTTASEGPADWSTADNWSDGAVPVNSDTVIIAANSGNIAYGLDQNAVDLDKLVIEQSYTGKIGLPYNAFTNTQDGDDPVTTAVEYREHYLKIGATVIEIGNQNAVTTQQGSGRLKINNDKAGAANITIFRTATVSADTGLPAVRLLGSHASIDIFVREAKGGVGIAVDEPNETATIGDLSVPTLDTQTRVFVGAGVTLSTYHQGGGNNVLNAAATITSAKVDGGTLTIEGDYTITTLTVNGGSVIDNHKKTAGNAITTLVIKGGSVDLTRSSEARTIAAVNPDGGTLITDDSYITLTAINEPAGKRTISIS